MALELHEPVSRSERARTIDDVLERARELPAHGDYLEQMRFLCDTRSILHETARARLEAPEQCPVLDANRLREFRRTLTMWIDGNAEQLGASEAPDVAWIVGWSRLALAWTLVCYSNVILETNESRDAFFPVASEWLRRQELVINAGIAVDDYSTTELVDALYQLRRRLERLESIDFSLLGYVAALERRCSVLIAGAFSRSANVHDDVRWRNDDVESFKASRAFVTATAWWFLVVRRYLRDYRETMLPSFYSPRNETAAPRCPVVGLRVADERIFGRVYQFIVDLARRFKTEHHTKAFQGTAAAYCTVPGGVEACERVRTDGEKVGWREALTTMASGPAADYVARSKFKRKLLVWVELYAYRRRHNDSRPVLGGDGIFEDLAILHTVRVFFRNQYGIPFGEWFVVMHRNAHKRVRDYQLRIRQKLAVPSPRPFIVQRLGRWGVVVPRVELEHAGESTLQPLSLERRVFITLGIDLEMRLVSDDEQLAQLYEFATVMDAFVAWCTFMHFGWDGRMHSQATCTRLLHDLLGIRGGEDATSTRGSTAQELIEHIGRPRPAPTGTILADL